MELLSYSNWDGRPAVLFRKPNGAFFALAKLSDETDWVSVDALGVAHTAGVISSVAALERVFGPLDVPSAEKATRLSKPSAAE